MHPRPWMSSRRASRCRPTRCSGRSRPRARAGAFTSRLPQIVLRRRTLPWERSTDLAPGDHADAVARARPHRRGRGTASNRRRRRRNASRRADARRPSATSRKARASRSREASSTEDLPDTRGSALLSHVREVDIADTELAMGDDDGCLAVVLCNRLPQAGRALSRVPDQRRGPVPRVCRPSPKSPASSTYVRFVSVLDLRAEAATSVRRRVADRSPPS